MAFINSLATSFILLLLFVALAGVGVFLGITLRKRSDGKKEDVAETPKDGEA